MPRDTATTILDAQRIQADFVRTELELGVTFLDVAASSKEAGTMRRSVRNAITALRSANRFLSTARLVSSAENAAISRRRDELWGHLREVLRRRHSR